MRYSLGIDTGGTHTDFILVDRKTGQTWTTKVPTTPADPLKGILRGVERLLTQSNGKISELDELVYGTTIVTNMLVQHQEVRTALITTHGFRDVLEIGRAYRTGNIYDIQFERQPPLVPRRLRMEVTERINFRGEVLEPLDEENCRAVVRVLKRYGVTSIAVCFLHSYVNPQHERRARAIIEEEYPEAHVSLSCEIHPVFREFERTSTTVVNAYVTPRMVEHLEDFERRTMERGLRSRLYTMQANGGRATFRAACRRPVHVTNSGPIAGAIAGAYVARLAGFLNAITLDMGGTSCDVALIDEGRLIYASESRVEGYPVQIPTIDLNIVGAGGGSIAWLDKGLSLRVGPSSAGADPGPVCYGIGGTRPTVTDANLVTGRLNREYFLGGEMRLDFKAAEAAICDCIALPLKMATLEAARGILEVANATMIRAIRLVSVERGYDPHDFALIAFGGAGPLHATWLAKELEIPVVIIPRYPGNTSALGLVLADVRHDYVATRIRSLDAVSPQEVEATFEELEAEAQLQLTEEEIPRERWQLTRSCDLRYFGQAYELNIPVEGGFQTPEDVKRIGGAFHDSHRRTYGHAMEGDPIDVVNYRVTAIGFNPEFDWGWKTQAGQDAYKGRRDVYFDIGYCESSIYERCRLNPGQQIDGPAVIEQADSTTILSPGDRARVDPCGNLVITLTKAEVCK